MECRPPAIRRLKLLVEPGVAVEQGQPLLILEAMKMEHRVCAPGAGTVRSFFFKAGEQVDGGAELLEFAPAE